jgi:hypothetical protein
MDGFFLFFLHFKKKENLRKKTNSSFFIYDDLENKIIDVN